MPEYGNYGTFFCLTRHKSALFCLGFKPAALLLSIRLLHHKKDGALSRIVSHLPVQNNCGTAMVWSTQLRGQQGTQLRGQEGTQLRGQRGTQLRGGHTIEGSGGHIIEGSGWHTIEGSAGHPIEGSGGHPIEGLAGHAHCVLQVPLWYISCVAFTRTVCMYTYVFCCFFSINYVYMRIYVYIYTRSILNAHIYMYLFHEGTHYTHTFACI